MEAIKEVLLCACKKYTRNQKNDILLVNINNQDIVNYKFYDTNNFEVFCFCQLMSFKKTFFSTSERDTTHTDFFLCWWFW